MIRLLVLSGLVLAAVTPVLAQPTRQQIRDACMADYQRFCSGTAPGGGRVLQCLRQRKSELSEACRELVENNG